MFVGGIRENYGGFNVMISRQKFKKGNLWVMVYYIFRQVLEVEKENEERERKEDRERLNGNCYENLVFYLNYFIFYQDYIQFWLRIIEYWYFGC